MMKDKSHWIELALWIIVDVVMVFIIQITWEVIDLLEYGFTLPSMADTIAALIIWWISTNKINERISRAMAKHRRNNVQRFPLADKSENTMVDTLRNTSVPILLNTIELMVCLLQEKGVEVKDWDDKTRTLKQIRRIGNGIYFFAETERIEGNEEAGSETESKAEENSEAE